jgi:pimeloyl-ACP methyl ester carboxylesterase
MRAELSGTFVEYDTVGSASNPCVLLIMGLGGSMIAWREKFCEMLADRSFFVVRFDNRDAGLSKHWDELGAPPIMRRALALTLLGRLCPKLASPYTLGDMATDAFELLDYLKIERAHLVGVSMGGMIAQTMALDKPERVASICSMSSTTGARNLGDGEPYVRLHLLKSPKSTSEEDRVAHSLNTISLISHPAPLDDDTPEYALNAIRRNPAKPNSFARQLNAIIAQPDRTSYLSSMTMPCIVIHGEGDRLVPLEHGEATARAMGGEVKKVVVKGMGHVMMRAFYAEIVDEIVSNALRGKLR